MLSLLSVTELPTLTLEPMPLVEIFNGPPLRLNVAVPLPLQFRKVSAWPGAAAMLIAPPADCMVADGPVDSIVRSEPVGELIVTVEVSPEALIKLAPPS